MSNVAYTTALNTAISRLQIANPGSIFHAFGLEYAFVSDMLAAKYPCVGDPTALTDADARSYGRAAGLTVAARLWQPLKTGSTSGNVSQVRNAEGSSVTFVAPVNASEGMMVEAAQALLYVSCIRNRAKANPTTLFQVVGRTRQLEAMGVPHFMLEFGMGLLDYGLYPLCCDLPLDVSGALLETF